MSKNIKKNSESKKNIKTSVSKTSKTSKPEKIIRKKPKKVEEFNEDEEDSLEEFDFEQEVEEKNKIERQIKGEKETIDNNVDKETIDKEINKTISNKIKDEPIKAVPAIKKTRKETVIDSIQDAYNKLDLSEEEKLTYAQLKATKINLLEKKLADLTEKIVSKLANKTEEIVNNNTNAIMSNDLCTEALFNVNLIMATFVENLAETGRKNEVASKYIPNINGFTRALLKPEKEKRLRECLGQIVKEHGETIKPYMSPIAVWLMYMITTATEVVSENMSKNLQEAIDI